MARRVKKRRKTKTPEAGLNLADYQFPGEKRVYWESVGGIVALFIFASYWVGFLGVWNENNPAGRLYHQWWALGVLPAYLVLSWGVANWLALRPRRRRIKEEGPSARVLNKNHPRLKAMLSEQSRLLGIDEPEMYVIEDDTPYLYSLPGKQGAVVATQAVLDTMNDEELAVLVARELGHVKSRHARMALVTGFVRRAKPPLQILLFPVWLVSLFLRGWMDLIDITSDRVSILVTERPALVNATLVKQAVAADREAQISREDLEAYLDTGMDISTDSAQIERHYKVGAFLSEQESLRDRIEEVTEFLRNDQGQQALEKIREVKQRIA